ncbi:Glyco_hydro_79n domain-containing protein [Cephalotus follicularis]|uniref:Glyco_hydro_79n domain-containing protein n=1 Tax=Cephalotus follicularis TaxID=3775 RepID=A0A1Q3AY92_CEPFO|nr:Glyco_hydro_79n domain-containing protein [Cephalotus follicularis]
MYSVFKLLCLSFWLPWLGQSATSLSSQSTAGPGNVIEGTVYINGTSSIAKTDENFICATLDWWPPDKCDYGTCSWGRASLLNLDLSNPILLNAVQAFSPLKIRMGGSLQDKVNYESKVDPKPCTPFVKNSSEMFGFSQGCLPMSRWDELNSFFKEAGAVVTFGLNALSGRVIGPDGSAVGAWNFSNAEALIRYTVNKGYIIYGWELGNELSGNGVGANIAADQYASDANSLQNLVQTIYSGFATKPLVIAPGGFFDANWFKEFINKSPNSLQVVTHHIYNLGPGVDDHLIDKILNPSYLESGSSPFINLQSILKTSATSVVAWVGEAGGAYNSGRNLVTNAFVFSFWYLDQLGMASTYDTKTYCRQTLIGGNYGLLNTSTFAPNPDYYSALLWHRLMGSNVLSTTFSGTNNIRAYAHCSKNSQGITLLLINLSNNTTVQVLVSTDNADINGTINMQQEQGRKTKYASVSWNSTMDGNVREEYHLTAKDGDLHSQTMLLNGQILAVTSSGTIPPLNPVHVRVSDPITVAPFSIVYIRFPTIILPACK